jgi:hypothetical protein
MTQTDRLQAYLSSHPGSSSLEITLAIGCVNVTGRVSDLRAKGVEVQARRDRDGVFRYRIVEPGQLEAGL